MPWSGSVSYTHLDVYKRQEEDDDGLHNQNQLAGYTGAQFHGFAADAEPCEEKAHQNDAEGIVAVSYTHLDVYKRQDLSRRAASARRPLWPDGMGLCGLRPIHLPAQILGGDVYKRQLQDSPLLDAVFVLDALYLALAFVRRPSGSVVRGAVPFLAAALLPFFWYLLAGNHSYIHSFFTYRALGVTLFASSCLFVSLGSRHDLPRLKQPSLSSDLSLKIISYYSIVFL